MDSNIKALLEITAYEACQWHEMSRNGDIYYLWESEFDRQSQRYSFDPTAEHSKQPDTLKLSWKTGGAQGGTCWGGEAQEYREDVSEPHFLGLEKLLLTLNPDFRLADYKTLESYIIKTERQQSEYYGNYTLYGEKSIPLDKLYQLIEKSVPYLNKSNIEYAFGLFQEDIENLKVSEKKFKY